MQVVYVTAVFPYVVLVAFLVRGLTLRGMEDGLAHLVTPRVRASPEPKRIVNATYKTPSISYMTVLTFRMKIL